MPLAADTLPVLLQDEFRLRCQRLWQALGGEPVLPEPAGRAQLDRVLACSRFVADALATHPGLLADLAAADLWQASSDAAIEQRLTAALAAAVDEDSLLKILRQYRRREMVRIIWRDICRTATLADTVREMTALADACIRQTLDWWHTRLVAELGEPVSARDGKPQRMVVIGMGKLGAGELNVSSDIDLIFTYPEAGETVGGRKALDNQEFFIRLGRKLIQSLDNHTADGQVFRVDMRLRPWGQSGALVLGFDSMEEYYQGQGREWERYAMIKARPITGDAGERERLMASLRPFTYRRYIDFSAVESLRDMKGMISREVRRKGMEANIKLGPGGIREIEFIVQSFQLIRGGREPALREPCLLKVLPWLGEHGYLPAAAVQELGTAYEFLRNAEHAIQGWDDKQTQMLPDDPLARAALAHAMGFAGWDAFVAALDVQRRIVQRHFSEVISGDEQGAATAADPGWSALWLGELADAAALEQLQAFAAPQERLAQLSALRESVAVRMMQAMGRERLDRFMPILLAAVARHEAPDAALQRLLPLVEAVARRTAYLVLLMENRAALEQMIRLCAASPWIAEQLARHPALLDELLDPRTLYSLPDRVGVARQLTEHMLRVPEDDLEQQMDQLRYFRLACGLRIAACEATGALPLMKVSDQLTWLAEALLAYALDLAWRELESRHGAPGGLSPEDARPFVIIGYGKLGGIELGHGSDLDLVFLYDAPIQVMTLGERALDNASFFTRLGQRIIHLLTAQTNLGKLYEVDMRLRPSGASGLLVSTVDAFEAYQQKDAWTWEHQALSRARPVAGSARLGQRFEDIRRRILCRERDLPTLRQEVAAMRAKMREHLLSAAERDEKSPSFPLKQGRGGIVDIEFMVQYAVLAWAHRYPSLVEFTDNVRILEALAREGLLSAAEAERLRAAWLDYRMAQHRLALQQQPGEVPVASVAAHREAVTRQWQDWIEPGPA